KAARMSGPPRRHAWGVQRAALLQAPASGRWAWLCGIAKIRRAPLRPAAALEARRHDLNELARAERLLNAGGGAELRCHRQKVGGALRRIAELESGHGYHRNIRGALLEVPDALEPVHAGHEDVDDDEIEPRILQGGDAAAAIFGDDDFE